MDPRSTLPWNPRSRKNYVAQPNHPPMISNYRFGLGNYNDYVNRPYNYAGNSTDSVVTKYPKLFQDPAVIHLTPQNFGFDRITHGAFAKPRYDDKYGYVVFYKPGCPWCKNMEEEYCKAARFCRGVIPFAAIDGSDERNIGLLENYHISRFPTIKVIKNGFLFTEYHQEPDYRKASQFIKFMCDRIPQGSKNMHVCS